MDDLVDFFVYFLILIFFGAQYILDYLNRSRINKALASGKNLDANYLKSLHYTLAKSNLHISELFFDIVLLICIYYFSLLSYLYEFFKNDLWSQSFYIIACVFIYSLLKMGFGYFKTFYIESKYGFNNATRLLWISDKLKAGLIAFGVGVLIVYGVLFLINTLSFWWLWGILFIFSFQLIMMVLVPLLILPLFNKYEPLQDGELKKRLMTLADKTGFGCRSIQTVDGSKRSNHSNAYFTGFGRFRKIVIFDTLLKQLSAVELEAVLAHEIGHYRLGHVPKMVLLSLISLVIFLGVIVFLLDFGMLYESFGFATTAVGYPAPIFVMLIFYSGLFTFWWSPISNGLSRSWEFQADQFSKTACGSGKPLISALEILSHENLSNPIPHPLYSYFYYSHPVLNERVAALN